MRYSVDEWLFERNPSLLFGIIIGKNIKNGESNEGDVQALENAQAALRDRITPDGLKTHPEYDVYRQALQNVGINPNKYAHSVEAMSKRVLKGDSLPRINALVDCCNVISLNEMISLGGHDLDAIEEDLVVRRSVKQDRFLPFGSTRFEPVDEAEIVFTSGNTVQTRQWLWRQSELGKMTSESNRIFFQLVGFEGPKKERLLSAMDQLEDLISRRFNGETQRFIVDRFNTSITFK